MSTKSHPIDLVSSHLSMENEQFTAPWATAERDLDIGILCNALISKTILASTLFGPPTAPKSKPLAKGKPNPPKPSDEDDDWDSGVPSMEELRQKLKREFTNYLGDKAHVRAFLSDGYIMAHAFHKDAAKYVEGTREYELGESIAEYFDITNGIDLMKMRKWTFACFCNHVMLVLKDIQVARAKATAKKTLKGKALSESVRRSAAAKRKLTKAQHVKANRELDSDGPTDANWAKE